MKFNLLRYTNLVILVTLIGLGVTGGAGLIWSQNAWLFDIHRTLGWVLILVIPWKARIAYRSLRRGFRKTFDRSWMILISLTMAGIALLVIVLGTLWLLRIGPEESWLRQTVISWHWMVGLALIAPLAIHVWRRWPKPKRVDFLSRRGALRSVSLGIAALFVWKGVELISQTENLDKRPTGSHEKGSQGNFFPITNRPEETGLIDLAGWRLEVVDLQNRSRAFHYSDLLAITAVEKQAVIDCTLGWFATQVWKGIPLAELLDLEQSGRVGVRLQSYSGYAQMIPLAEARQILLATHVGGQPLDQAHGFPLRAVVPSRRGWFWVKWLTQVKIVPL